MAATMRTRISPAQQALLDEARRNRNGVSVTNQDTALDFGTIEPAVAIAGAQKNFTMKVLTPSSVIRVVGVRWSASQTHPFTITLDEGNILSYREEAQIKIRLQQPEIGRYTDQLEISFEVTTTGKRFIILRSVVAVVGSQADHELLQPQAPYVPRRRARRRFQGHILEGVPPPRLQAVQWRGKLPKSRIPSALQALLSTPPENVAHEIKKRYLSGKPLSKKSYALFFKVLLWIEEVRMQSDLEVYDIEDALLTKHGVYYHLTVPGLAEKRPSVLIGDHMLVQRVNGLNDKLYEGHVHYIHERDVALRFHGSFPFSSTQRYHVHFLLNRVPLRRQHQILNMTFNAQHIFFPLLNHLGPLLPSSGTFTAFNDLIQDNPPQLNAIKAILNRPPGATPFILFGPPGTGKTVTGVEAVRQILTRNPNARILACAPSNSAADVIASRLVDIGPEALFRFYAPSREMRAVPAELLPFTFVNGDGLFSHPPLATVRQYRVIVSTCVSAAFATGIGIPRGHFTHIFVDEAGQATEPEVMAAVRSVADDRTNVVLLGDPKQLGPIIRSAVAREMGLETSYLERLMARDVYNAPASTGTSFVKLVKNYRSHETILRYPNERFYDAELETRGDPASINSFLGSPVLASIKFPIVFHATAGQDARESSSPSFFNVEEVLQVKHYVERLLSDTLCPIEAKEIGIITPYRAQCSKIRLALRAITTDIKVGSVEEFQGQASITSLLFNAATT
ncbi:P-loop containing nucleoside triphosphate hydrolase protein [Artomyces pyxidatus]|uniref:P-loop containing nucleoside triphosphate hydrolase protein n=1 Tax=Artomyces pyxidatus TaxID=48021 RepID=A0ACB8T2J4_9AGAM|nr:P-loop containing nucleoside triphosphate hydrolase protein [Artomyces pyxidatus]